MSAPDAPDVSGHAAQSQPEHTEAAAVETTKDEPAPAPSATVPAEPSTPETDPTATDSNS